MALLMADWGKSNSVVRYRPVPLGRWRGGRERPERPAEGDNGDGLCPVPSHAHLRDPCDVSLTWTAVPFAANYDVYFGTSAAARLRASRTDPLGRAGQPRADCDRPTIRLSHWNIGKTYYWRVDFVSTGPAPTIYKGPVLDFTTEAYAYPIKNVTATASSAQRPHGPGKDDRRLRARPERRTFDRLVGHVAEHGSAAQLDSVPVRQGLHPARAVGVELQSSGGAHHRLWGQDRQDRVLHRRHANGPNWPTCRSSPVHLVSPATSTTPRSASAGSRPSTSS